MARIWRQGHPIPWICDQSETEFRADIGFYHLRVVKKSQGNWNWKVYYLDERIETKLNEFAISKQMAIGLAEGLYLGHELYHRDPEIRFFQSSI